MSLRKPLLEDLGCSTCGFRLWEPIAESVHSKLGLYNDDRFPGRCILEYSEHRESLVGVPAGSLMGFLRDIQIAMEAIQAATGAEKVNVAVLGNREAHLHAHLIPRFPSSEEFPDCSPWNDRRAKGLLAEEVVEKVKVEIFNQIRAIDTRTDVLAPFHTPLFNTLADLDTPVERDASSRSA